MKRTATHWLFAAVALAVMLVVAVNLHRVSILNSSCAAAEEQRDDNESPAAAPAEPPEGDKEAEGKKPAEKEEPKAKEPLKWERPRFEERKQERLGMVRTQIEKRRVKDKTVLEAMRNVPRHLFVPDRLKGAAYRDTPLPIGYGQTISQPYIVAYMTELLDVKPGEKVLEIGTGSSYQAAVLSELTPYVYTIEIIRELTEQAGKRLRKLEYKTIKVKQGDGYHGWKEHAPFDGIIVTAAAGHVPPPLVEQLKPRGVMVIPVGGVFEVQQLKVITKQEDGRIKTRSVLPVRFVPMTGRVQEGS